MRSFRRGYVNFCLSWTVVWIVSAHFFTLRTLFLPADRVFPNWRFASVVSSGPKGRRGPFRASGVALFRTHEAMAIAQGQPGITQGGYPRS